ncbi:hypothetical protein K2173_017341 [Erythroxylum novogranatense]|uniref:GAG-pre-integrase domain-containing protein n=1 Tax=Erythroxylum novogranatense TaxID=1862640 RepID=A0AAV8TKD4_9ROSI|nr:hypothetical protein K2173_017341 [Erythroxylum novogranatense]
MKVYMKAQDVWQAVESPGPIDPREDMMALAAIYQGISEETLLQLGEKETAKEAWDALKVMNLGAERVKEVRAQALKWELESMRMEDSESVDEFTGKISTVVNKLRALGETVDEKYVVKKMLRSVSSKYLQIASTIEEFGDLSIKTIEEVTGSLKAHEERLRSYDSKGDEHVLLTKGEWKARAESSRTNEKPDKKKQNEAHLVEHVEDESTLLMLETSGIIHIDEEKKVELMLNEEQPHDFDEEEMRGTMWYCDTGASNHMTGNKLTLTNLDESIEGNVRLGDGSVIKVEGKGTAVFHLGQLDESGARVVVKGGTLRIYDAKDRLIAKVQRAENRLYTMRMTQAKLECHLSRFFGKSCLWHARYGHLNYQALHKLAQESMVKGLPEIVPVKHICEQSWHGRSPSVHHMSVFGCIAYAKNAAPHLQKLDDRSMKLVLLGYEAGSKAYRLLNPSTNRIVVSRDVVFQEEEN